MPRIVWKGAITFGLVHIPITLRAAARSQDLDFDWLDKRDMAPVGYQRINKRTGEKVESEHIVKGYQYEKGEYVLMTDEDFRAANPQATQTIDILQFVEVAEVPPHFYEQPYYLEAGKRGEKGYALLRETLRRAGRAGVANVVMYRKQHLALLMVVDNLLLLNTLRWGAEVLAPEDMNVPPDDLAEVGVRANEIAMAQQLVEEMSAPFDAQQYRDTYREDLLKRIDARIKGGQTHVLTPAGEEAPAGAQVIDLMAALKASLARGGRKPAATPRAPAPAERRAAADDAGAGDDTRPARGSRARNATREPATAAAAPRARKTAGRGRAEPKAADPESAPPRRKRA